MAKAKNGHSIKDLIPDDKNFNTGTEFGNSATIHLKKQNRY